TAALHPSWPPAFVSVAAPRRRRRSHFRFQRFSLSAFSVSAFQHRRSTPPPELDHRNEKEDRADDGCDDGATVARAIDDQSVTPGIFRIIIYADLLTRCEVELLPDVAHMPVAPKVVEIAAAIAFLAHV